MTMTRTDLGNVLDALGNVRRLRAAALDQPPTLTREEAEGLATVDEILADIVEVLEDIVAMQRRRS